MHDVERPEILLQARSGWIPVDWRELYVTRELYLAMVARDLKVRYKQTVLGVGWAVIQPLVTMLVVARVFQQIVQGVDTGGVPYPLFVYVALVPWTFFSNAVNAAGISAITQQHLLSKIYFPRVYAPGSAIGAALVDMLIAFLLVGLLMPYYHVMPSWQIVFVPILIVLSFLATAGVGLATAAMVVLFRDFRYVLTFVIQVVVFVTPVYFPTNYYKSAALFLALNPIFGLIDAFRSAIFGTPWNVPVVAISTASTLVIFTFGIYFFRRIERHMADVV